MLDHRGEGAARRYLIKWVGTEDHTWLRVSQLRYCRRLLHDYQEAHGLSLDQWTASSSSSSPESNSETAELTT